MRLKTAAMTATAFALAAGLCVAMAIFLGNALESRSQRHVTRALAASGLTWATVSADGLLVTLGGTAPTEALRFRATTVAGRVVGSARVFDTMDVAPATTITAPRFSLELLRNDDGISMIGLVPEHWNAEALVEAAAGLSQDGSLTNMLETADFAIPAGWVEATEFGMAALRLLPRSKISVAADRVEVTAISDSPAQKRRFESDLGRALPKDVAVDIRISAPRPVIAPFTLRFVIDADGPRFDACAADTERAKGRILTAARLARVPGMPACTLGLGAPSPRWADAAEAVIAAMAELGEGSVTVSDVDVTLIAAPSVAQADFDRVVGELTARLPDVFSLKATLVPRPAAEGPSERPRFTATLSPEGLVQLRGRLPDEQMRDALAAFAQARFGAANVYVATRQDDALPPGWGLRAMAALAGLGQLAFGAVEVEPDHVGISGTSGNPEARAEIARILSDQLGQGAPFAVNVSYDERLDPNRALPGPDACLSMATAVLEARQIGFAPGKAEIESEARSILEDLALALRDCKAIPLEIGGHTDSQGRAETNLRLSQERAEAVLAMLDELGVDTSEMSARGYGASEPIADNATEEGRVANRRIAVRLSPPDSPAPGPALIEIEPEDDGEALAPPPARPEDLLEPAGNDAGEPMGEAGDIAVTETEAEPEPAAAQQEQSGVVPGQPPGETAAQPQDPAAAASDTADPEAPISPDAVSEPTAVDGSSLVRQALTEPDAADWQADAEAPGLRPLRRPETAVPDQEAAP